MRVEKELMDEKHYNTVLEVEECGERESRLGVRRTYKKRESIMIYIKNSPPPPWCCDMASPKSA